MGVGIDIRCALYLCKCVAEKDCVGTIKESHLQEYSCIDVDGGVHFGKVFQIFSQEKFRISKEGVLWFLSLSIDGRMSDRMLNPAFSLASANDLVSWVWSSPCKVVLCYAC